MSNGPLTGHEDHSVTLVKAKDFTKNYRDKSESGDVLGGYFSKDAIESVTLQTYPYHETILAKGDKSQGANINDGLMKACLI